jgi:oligosaccharide repeat unit polymerase
MKPRPIAYECGRPINYSITVLVYGFAVPACACIAFAISPIAVMCYLLSLLTVINYRMSRDVLYPAFVFCAIWLIAATVYLLCPFEIDPLTWTTCAFFVFGALCFSLGCILGDRALITNRNRWFIQETTNSLPRRLLLIYSCLTLPLFVRDTIRLAGGFSFSPQFIISARDAIIATNISGEARYSSMLVSTAPMVSILCAWLLLIEDKSRILKGIAVTVVFIMCLLSTGRNMFLQFLIGWIVIVFLRAQDRSFAAMKKKGLVVLISVVALLSVLSLITKQATQGDNALQVTGTMTVEYIAGPLAAFNFEMNHFSEMYQGDDQSKSFVRVPFPTNVFTFYQDYYTNWGASGCFLALLVVGFVHGRLFYTSIHGNRVAVLFMIYLYYALALSIFSDAYSLASRHVEVIGYAVFYFWVLRNIPRVSLHIELFKYDLRVNRPS